MYVCMYVHIWWPHCYNEWMYVGMWGSRIIHCTCGSSSGATLAANFFLLGLQCKTISGGVGGGLSTSPLLTLLLCVDISSQYWHWSEEDDFIQLGDISTQFDRTHYIQRRSQTMQSWFNYWTPVLTYALTDDYWRQDRKCRLANCPASSTTPSPGTHHFS